MTDLLVALKALFLSEARFDADTIPNLKDKSALQAVAAGRIRGSGCGPVVGNPFNASEHLVEPEASGRRAASGQPSQALAEVPGRKRPGYAPQVPPLAGPLVLNKQGRDMAPHIAADLRPQSLQGATVEVIEDRAWFVPADRAGV